MSDSVADRNSGCPREARSTSLSGRISVPEIARRLDVGRLAVYEMLEQGILPGIRLGRRWMITRYAYDQWERNCGMRAGIGLLRQPEVTVLN
jgi:excisionase family DNA binding protein